MKMYIGAPFEETLFQNAEIIISKEMSEAWLNIDYPKQIQFKESSKPLILKKGDSVAIFRGYQSGIKIFAVYTVEK